jgi:hypothetical protein
LEARELKYANYAGEAARPELALQEAILTGVGMDFCDAIGS